MRHKRIRALVAARILWLLAHLDKLPKKARDYQIEALQALLVWLQDTRGTRRGHIVHATGLGKTFLFAAILKACKEFPILVIVPSKVLLEQTAQRIFEFTGQHLGHHSGLGKIYNSAGEVIAVKNAEANIVVTTDESFKMNPSRMRNGNVPYLIVWDECHWGYTENAQAALKVFPEAIVLGFTATPDYLTVSGGNGYVEVEMDNGQTLYGRPDRFARKHFGELIDNRPVKWGIEHAHLAPLHWGQIDLNVSLEGVRIVNTPAGRDYHEGDLQERLLKNWNGVCEIMRRLYKSSQYDLPKRQSAAICPGVAAAEQLAETIRRAGISAECITGYTPDHVRKEILEAYAAGEVKLVTSVFVLREGWDAPNAEVGMMLRPTQSRVLYVQFMGRPLRLDPKNPAKRALILDPHFVGTRLAPLSAPLLFGKPGDRIEEGGELVGPKGPYGPRGADPKIFIPKGVKPRIIVLGATEKRHWAKANGTLEADGEMWGSLLYLTRVFGLSSKTIEKLGTSCRKKQVFGPRGVLSEFYALKDIEKVCKPISEIPKAGKNGLINWKGEAWGSIKSLAVKLGVAEATIKEKISTYRKMEGRDSYGHARTFYALKDAKKACARLLKKIDVADSAGFIQVDGEKWATLTRLAIVLGLKQKTIKRRCKKCRKRKGKNASGRIVMFYALSDIKKVCAELLRKTPVVGNDNLITYKGEKWYSKRLAEKKLGRSHHWISERAHLFRKLKGKDVKGHLLTFYAWKDLANVSKKSRRWNVKKT